MFCLHCGSANPGDARACVKCGKPLAPEASGDEETEGTPKEARDTSTPDPPPQDRVGAGKPIAGMGDRLIAVLLDTLLGAAFFALVGMWLAVGREGVTEGGFSLTGTPALIVLLLCVGAGFLYYWLLEGWTGATLGKAIAGVRVLKKDGTRPDMKVSLIRNLLRVVDIIGVYLVGFLVAVLSKQRQRIGDHIAGTVVVEHSPRRALRAAAVFLWLVLIGGGVVGAVMVHRQATPLSFAVPEGAVTTAAQEAPNGGTLEAPGVDDAASTTAQEQVEWSVLRTGEMEIAHFAFLEEEDGAPRATSPYAPGDKIFIEYSVAGFDRNVESQMNLGLEAVTMDSNGVFLHEPWTQTLEQSSDGTPVTGSYSATIPIFAPPGIYEFKLNVRDRISETQLVLTAHPEVEVDPIEPASALEIRDFILSFTERGEGADPPVLNGGGTVYMRCKLFGIKLQDDMADIQMAFQVTAPDGEVLLDEPQYFHDRDKYFYHPDTFYLPIYGHVTLPGGLPEGTYTLRYTAWDNLAGEEIIQIGTVEVRLGIL